VLSDLITESTRLWEHLRRRFPPDTVLVGSADHGHCDIPPGGKKRLSWDLNRAPEMLGRRPVLMFNGPAEQARRLAEQTGSRFVDAQLLRQWLGGGPPHPELEDFPTAALLPAEHTVIFPRLPRRGHGRTPRRHHIPRTTHPAPGRLTSRSPRQPPHS